MLRSPTAGAWAKASPLALRAFWMPSSVAPAPAVTRREAQSTDTSVSALVSTKSTRAAAAVASRVSGDQLCRCPMARSRQPAPVAQFARSATWPAVVTRTCQVASMRISPSPLTYAATKALRPPGSVGGDPIPAVVISAAVAGRAVQ